MTWRLKFFRMMFNKAHFLSSLNNGNIVRWRMRGFRRSPFVVLSSFLITWWIIQSGIMKSYFMNHDKSFCLVAKFGLSTEHGSCTFIITTKKTYFVFDSRKLLHQWTEWVINTSLKDFFFLSLHASRGKKNPKREYWETL